MKIYVASSWRNQHQPEVVRALKEDGHEVYDFRDEQGFSWRNVDPNWQQWKPREYLLGLLDRLAEAGFNRDFRALQEADAVVYVMPCGVSASLELGWAIGRGKLGIVYAPEIREPELMVKMSDYLALELEDVREILKHRGSILRICEQLKQECEPANHPGQE